MEDEHGVIRVGVKHETEPGVIVLRLGRADPDPKLWYRPLVNSLVMLVHRLKLEGSSTDQHDIAI